MKNTAFIFLSFLLFIAGFSQISGYEYTGRFTPSVKKEKLKKAQFLGEIMPQFTRHFMLPFSEQSRLNKLLKLAEAPAGYYLYPQESFYPQQNYEKLIDYVSIEITTISNGKVFTSQSSGSRLSAEQKRILNAADLGTDVSIKIHFKYKYGDTSGNTESKIKEGRYVVTIVPETEAEYPGGFKQLTAHLNEHVFNKLPAETAPWKILQTIVKFTINEEGQLTDAKITNSSTDPELDKLVLEAIHKMPKWKPAENKGIKVKQEINISFNGGGC